MNATATSTAKARAIERLTTVLCDDWFTTDAVEDLSDAVRNLLPSGRRAEYVPFDADCRRAMVLFRNED